MRNKVIATVRQNYGGLWFNSGQTITTKTERDAEDIVAVNRGQWPVDKPDKRHYKRRDMRSEH
jgi:hypothetical protein